MQKPTIETEHKSQLEALQEKPGLLYVATAGVSEEAHKSTRVLYGVGSSVLFLDQLLKMWVRANLAPGETRHLIPGIVHLTHVENPGAAWGMLSGERWPLIVISLLVVAALLFSTRQIAARGMLVSTGMGLVFGGAVGNLIDRSAFGVVTDMIDMDTRFNLLRNFPVFNLADASLTCGVCVLIYYLLRGDSNPAVS